MPPQHPSLSEIHPVIHSSSSLNNAAIALKMHSRALDNLLARYPYKDKYLSYPILKSLAIEEARQEFGALYDVQPSPHKLNVTLKKVHHYVLNSRDSEGVTALKMGVSQEALQRWLGQLELDFSELGSNSPEEIIRRVGITAYLGIIENSHNMSNYTLAQIYDVICTHDSHDKTAKHFRISSKTLTKHLNQFSYKGAPLTFKVLKSLTEEELCIIQSNAYDNANERIDTYSYEESKLRDRNDVNPNEVELTRELGMFPNQRFFSGIAPSEIQRTDLSSTLSGSLTSSFKATMFAPLAPEYMKEQDSVDYTFRPK